MDTTHANFNASLPGSDSLFVDTNPLNPKLESLNFSRGSGKINTTLSDVNFDSAKNRPDQSFTSLKSDRSIQSSLLESLRRNQDDLLPVVPSRHKTVYDRSTQAEHRRKHLIENDQDQLTGRHLDKHLVGEDHDFIKTSDRNLRSLGASSFPGRLLKYVPGTSHMQGADVRQWQLQMQKRGWNIAVDGDYGSQSAKVARSFQAEKSLTVDGIVGKQTWDAAFNLPISTPVPSPSPSPSGATGQAIANLARDIVEGKYNGGHLID